MNTDIQASRLRCEKLQSFALLHHLELPASLLHQSQLFQAFCNAGEGLSLNSCSSSQSLHRRPAPWNTNCTFLSSTLHSSQKLRHIGHYLSTTTSRTAQTRHSYLNKQHWEMPHAVVWHCTHAHGMDSVADKASKEAINLRR